MTCIDKRAACTAVERAGGGQRAARSTVWSMGQWIAGSSSVGETHMGSLSDFL